MELEGINSLDRLISFLEIMQQQDNMSFAALTAELNTGEKFFISFANQENSQIERLNMALHLMRDIYVDDVGKIEENDDEVTT